jgi:hypothetical protein
MGKFLKLKEFIIWFENLKILEFLRYINKPYLIKKTLKLRENKLKEKKKISQKYGKN